MKSLTFSLASILILTSTSVLLADTPMLVPITPALSPDGSVLVFSWENDLWKVSTNPDDDAPAQRLTIHPAKEYNPIFSPDGATLYYNSDKEGSTQIFAMPLDKSTLSEQITYHSVDNILEDLSGNSDHLTITYRSARDQAGQNSHRIYQSSVSTGLPEKMLFNAYALNTKVSPDGTNILFTREGAPRYRIGYYGSQASQIWLYDINAKTFTQPVSDSYGCLSPLWLKDGSGFYYVCGKGGHFNLWKHEFTTSTDTQITNHTDSNVMFPVISMDRSTIVYRHLFHYYRLDTKTNKSKRLTLKHNLALKSNKPKDTALNKTDDADFSPSGLEIAFSAKGNIFAMDTVLREPVQLTHTAGYETNIYFGDKGRAIYFISDDGITTSINKITKSDPSQYWWETDSVKTSTLVESEPKSTIKSFTPSPDGKFIGYSTAAGKLFIYDLKTKKNRLVTQSWNTPSFNWSPNSEWITYSIQNNNFNSDIYLVPTDGSQEPVNVTKHPDNEFAPSFSPDGKKLAFIGKRHSSSYDLYYVNLTPNGSEKSVRDKKIETANNAMKKDPSYATPVAKLKSIIKKLTPNKTVESTTKPSESSPLENKKTNHNPSTSNPAKPNDPENTKPSKIKPKFTLNYQLTDIQKRIKHIPLKAMHPSQMFWKHDSKAILIQSKKSGKVTYAFDLISAKSTKYVAAAGTPIRYDKCGKLYWVTNSIPGILKGGKSTNYDFVAQTEFDLAQHQRYKFRLIWRTIRDGFYDETMNGTNWDSILTKYEDAATSAKSGKSFDRIVSMLLGELNASHTGYRGTDTRNWKKQVPWREEMLHLGITYSAKSDGWHITKVFTNSPANGKLSTLEAGEIITEINETKVDDKTLLKDVLWGQIKDSLQLKVLNINSEKRNVNLAPISYTSSRALVSVDKITENKAMVEKLSSGKFGYIHVARMQWDEFKKFEQHLYENGSGKDGLIIDVRDNGGGFTTDHLLTALTQPRHAYTVPRNGGLGYPQDRFVYATWQKPIVVLCNQNSFSNAEIFSHAIKTLKRGKLVGVPTAGGVISTGSANILNEGKLRMPFRGWFLSTNGEDMELIGATPEPDNIIWPAPGELETGIDKQIEKAIEVLSEEVKTKQKTPITPKYRNRK